MIKECICEFECPRGAGAGADAIALPLGEGARPLSTARDDGKAAVSPARAPARSAAPACCSCCSCPCPRPPPSLVQPPAVQRRALSLPPPLRTSAPVASESASLSRRPSPQQLPLDFERTLHLECTRNAAQRLQRPSGVRPFPSSSRSLQLALALLANPLVLAVEQAVAPGLPPHPLDWHRWLLLRFHRA